MANNRLPFGLCKKYHIELPDNATPKDAWQALKNNGIEYFEDDESAVIDPSKLLDGVDFDEPKHLTTKPTIPLPKKEYWKVCSALSIKLAGKNVDNLILPFKHGNYIYMVEVTGFDSYRIIGKERIK